MAGIMKRVGRKLREVYGGKNTYMPKKPMETIKTVTSKKPLETVRTKNISSGLRQAGLTDEEMARFRRKK